MATQAEPFLRGTNNLVELVLTEDGSPVPNLQLATQIDVNIGGLVLTRNGSGQGVDYSQGQGLVVLNPGEIPEDLTDLPIGWLPATITVFDPTNVQGVRFGGIDSDPRLYFSVR